MEMLYFLGIDVSKKKFDSALTLDGQNYHSFTCENSPEAIDNLFRDLIVNFSLPCTQLVVCMEYTGIYCYPLLEFLAKNQIKVCVERSAHIKRSQGLTRGKNDKIDARRIASYAYKNRQDLKFWHPQRMVIQKLKAMLVVRERLIKVKNELLVPIAESNEFVEESIIKMMAAGCKHTIKTLERDITKTEEMIAKLVKDDAELKHQHKIATSVTGIGDITALNMIITTGEFKAIQEAKKFACYAGVAPFEHSSGSSIRGKTRVSKMANMTIKKLLHLAAMTAVQYDDELSAYYQRKVTQGKNKMSVINAVRNKLISRVFACIHAGRPYQKNYNNALA